MTSMSIPARSRTTSATRSTVKPSRTPIATSVDRCPRCRQLVRDDVECVLIEQRPKRRIRQHQIRGGQPVDNRAGRARNVPQVQIGGLDERKHRVPDGSGSPDCPRRHRRPHGWIIEQRARRCPRRHRAARAVDARRRGAPCAARAWRRSDVHAGGRQVGAAHATNRASVRKGTGSAPRASRSTVGETRARVVHRRHQVWLAVELTQEIDHVRQLQPADAEHVERGAIARPRGGEQAAQHGSEHLEKGGIRRVDGDCVARAYDRLGGTGSPSAVRRSRASARRPARRRAARAERGQGRPRRALGTRWSRTCRPRARSRSRATHQAQRAGETGRAGTSPRAAPADPAARRWA